MILKYNQTGSELTDVFLLENTGPTCKCKATFSCATSKSLNSMLRLNIELPHFSPSTSLWGLGVIFAQQQHLVISLSSCFAAFCKQNAADCQQTWQCHQKGEASNSVMSLRLTGNSRKLKRWDTDRGELCGTDAEMGVGSKLYWQVNVFSKYTTTYCSAQVDHIWLWL